jgi:tRNA dimethylallyltransferase
MKTQKLIIICGPTACGKTALAVSVARQFGGEVISADSMQIYRGMDIGTAKPTISERGGVPHHMIDCAWIGEDYSAAIYQKQARECIEDITARGKLPILCGGTGLFISATVYPLNFSDAGMDAVYRADLEEYVRKFGNDALHHKLADVDPESAKSIHPNNVKRVIRALEKARSFNPDSTNNAETDQLFNASPLYDLAWIGLTMDRAVLYQRIEARVDEMMRHGLLDEVMKLSKVHNRDSKALQGLGYKELLAHIDGAVPLDKAIEQIKKGTRNYAKRQLTWFRRDNHIQWFDVGDFTSDEALNDAVFGYIMSSLHIS